MESYTSRLSTIGSTFATALAITAVLNAFSVVLWKQNPTGNIAVAGLLELNVQPYLQADQLNLDFNAEADLRSAFQWNTHQLFVYVVASYETPQLKRNQVVVWDRIVRSKEEAVFSEVNLLNEYPLRDKLKQLRGQEVTLTLYYNYMPIVGLLQKHEVASTKFTVPQEYFRYDKEKHRQRLQRSSPRPATSHEELKAATRKATDEL